MMLKYYIYNHSKNEGERGESRAEKCMKMEYYGRSEREDKKEHNFVIKFLGIARLSY
jgi:hypothetical protein